MEMKYETRDVFIVKYTDGGCIAKVFGIESEAEDYIQSNEDTPMIIDVWPCEFRVSDKSK